MSHPTLISVPATVEEAIALLKSWDYYDNTASGEYVNENQNISEGKPSYNEFIFIWNGSIVFREQNIWQGDISFRRMLFIIEAGKKFGCCFEVYNERNLAYYISAGTILERSKMFPLTLIAARASGFKTAEEYLKATTPAEEQELAAGLGALFG